MPDAVPLFRTPVIGPGGYPLTPKPNRVEEESSSWLDREIAFDAPYRQVMLLANRETFRAVKLIYESRPKADLDVFRDFWLSVKGMAGTFLFTHPVTNATWRARFARDLFSFTYDESSALYSGAPAYTFEIEIEEAP